MVEKILFIELFQPFAQYRNPFTFYYAQTYPLPPKSTVIGMLQNACDDWYGNGFGIDNWWKLKVSMHGGFENAFWNYQNLIKGKTELQQKDGKLVLVNQNLPLYGQGITSQRSPVHQQELFNGRIFLFIRGEEKLIGKIKESLEHPKKVLSLGRSEDVVFIEHVQEVNAADTVENITDVKIKYPTYIKEKEFRLKKQKYPVYSIPVEVRFMNGDAPVKSKSEITKKTERKPKFGTVIYTGNDYSIILNSETRMEVYNVNGAEFKILDNGWL